MQHIKITHDPALSQAEVDILVAEEVVEWAQQGKELASLDFQLDRNEVLVKATEKSPIRRVRRITGYLSNIENFNSAKKAECADRIAHGG